MIEWLPVLVALITGAFSAPVWTYLSRRFGWNISEMDRLRREHRTCEEQLRELTVRVAIIEHHHSSAFARWISDAKRRIVYVNAKALVSIFGPMGLSRDQVEGKSFHDFVDKGAADELELLAGAALAHDGSAVSNLIRLHPDLPVMHIVKIAAAGRDGELIFEALAFRMNDPDISLGLGIARTAAARAVSIDRLSEGGDTTE